MVGVSELNVTLFGTSGLDASASITFQLVLVHFSIFAVAHAWRNRMAFVSETLPNGQVRSDLRLGDFLSRHFLHLPV